jgi:hypothetical protein
VHAGGLELRSPATQSSTVENIIVQECKTIEPWLVLKVLNTLLRKSVSDNIEIIYFS